LQLQLSAAQQEAAVLRELLREAQQVSMSAGDQAGGSSSRSSDWDGALASAEEALRGAMERLMEGDERAEPEYEKWAQRVSTHPEHLAAEKLKDEEWAARERPKCAAALAYMRSIVPEGIMQTTRSALAQQGMPGPLLKRLWEKRVIWFVHMDEQSIAKIHPADLSTKYSHDGCDISECRAVWEVHASEQHSTTILLCFVW
jgi:hypothetical protein